MKAPGVASPGRPSSRLSTTGEISIFVGPSFVITVRHGAANDLHDARLRLDQRPDLLRAGTAAALRAILDTVVDGYAPVRPRG